MRRSFPRRTESSNRKMRRRRGKRRLRHPKATRGPCGRPLSFAARQSFRTRPPAALQTRYRRMAAPARAGDARGHGFFPTASDYTSPAADAPPCPSRAPRAPSHNSIMRQSELHSEDLRIIFLKAELLVKRVRRSSVHTRCQLKRSDFFRLRNADNLFHKFRSNTASAICPTHDDVFHPAFFLAKFLIHEKKTHTDNSIAIFCDNGHSIWVMEYFF